MTMTLTDHCCTIAPYFTVKPGQLEAFRRMCEQFVARTKPELKCRFYGFSFDGDRVHCREGYADAEGMLHHLDSIGALLQEALKIADLTRLEIHAPADQIELLRQPLAKLNPEFYVMECGFRR